MAIASPALLAGIHGSRLSEKTIRLEYDGDEYTVALAELDVDDFYYVSGDGGSTDALLIIEEALDTAIPGNEFDLTVDGNGHVRFDADLSFRILGTHADTTLDLTILGLDNTTAFWPAVATAFYVVPRQHAFGWFPIDEVSWGPLDQLPVVATGSVTISGDSRVIKLSRARGRTRPMGWDNLDGALVRSELADADHVLSTFETTWNRSISEGDPFRYYADTLARDDYKTYRVNPSLLRDEPWSEANSSALFWNVRLPAMRVDD